MKRVLVIAAHPDDEVLGCGATMAMESAAGARVRTVLMTSGVTSRHSERTAEVEAQVHALRQEALAANRLLGVPEDDVIFGGYVDQGLDDESRRSLVHFLRTIVQEYKPDVVYTHHARDYNLDHRIVFDATLSATRPYQGEHVPAEVYAYEVNSSTEWGWQVRDAFRPTMYVDVGSQLGAKKAALAAYVSELHEHPHPRSIRGIEILAQKRGLEISTQAAEAFETIRCIR